MRGKLAILFIFTLALTMAGFAWWWNYQRAARAREFWGLNGAAAIRFGQDVKVMTLHRNEPSDSPSYELKIAGRSFALENKTDLSGLPGLLNARQSLTVDESFDWTRPTSKLSGEEPFTHAVRFTEGERVATVMFDFAGNQLGYLEGNQAVKVQEKTARGWETYLKRHMPEFDQR